MVHYDILSNKQTNHWLALLLKDSTVLMVLLPLKPPMAKILSSMTAVANLLRRERMRGMSVHFFVLGSYLSPQRTSNLPDPPAYKYILHHVSLYKNGLPNELFLTAISSILLHYVTR
jgi:hypothetical protein